jgi:hypothetical protein
VSAVEALVVVGTVSTVHGKGERSGRQGGSFGWGSGRSGCQYRRKGSMLHVVVFSFVAPVVGVVGPVVGPVVVVVVAAAVVGIAPTNTSLPTTTFADPSAAAHGKCCCSIHGHQGK